MDHKGTLLNTLSTGQVIRCIMSCFSLLVLYRAIACKTDKGNKNDNKIKETPDTNQKSWADDPYRHKWVKCPLAETRLVQVLE